MAMLCLEFNHQINKKEKIMTNQQSTKLQQTNRDATVKIVPTENLFEHLKEIYQSTAHRAYEHFEGRGQEDGHDLDDWFRAEAELLWPMPVEMVEFNDHITVRTKTPGFRCKELEIGVEPNRLIINGKTEQE